MSFDIVKSEQLPLLPENWDYESSVAYLKPKIEHCRQEIYEIACELYKAKNKLSSPGKRTDLLLFFARGNSPLLQNIFPGAGWGIFNLL